MVSVGIAIEIAGADTERAEAPGVGVAVSLVGETDVESLPVLQAVRKNQKYQSKGAKYTEMSYSCLRITH